MNRLEGRISLSFRLTVIFGLFFGSVGGCVAAGDASGTEAIALGFTERSLGDTWQVVEFPDVKPTAYRYDADSDAVCARAESSAAGLARDFPDVGEGYTTLRWEWRIGGHLERGNAREKSGDDYAGRVYVNYQGSEGLSYWQQFKLSAYEAFYGRDIPRRSINFIWANVLEPGTIVPSPYTDRVKLVALRNRTDPTDTWVEESVDFKHYYGRIYDSQYATPDSLAIMTDTDNTEDTVTTCYRNIRLTR